MRTTEPREIIPTTAFRKDLKLMQRRGANLKLMRHVLTLLANREVLPAALRDHALTGKHAAHRECHIQPDWLLIYRIDGDDLILVAMRTGTHSDLFDR